MKQAADLLGGPARLRESLKASSADVAAWLAGTKEPPQAIFLRVVEIILDELDRRGG
ncbi:MAG: hypothetical protein ACM30H_08355 [Clostridia bacterium]